MTPQEIFDELKKTIKEFQAENDKQLAEFKAGLSTAATNDKVEALNARITELKGMQDDLLKQISHLEIGGAGEKKEDRLKMVADARQFFAGARGVDVRRVTDNDVEAYKAYCNAYPEWLRRGGQALNDPDIRAAMQVGSDPDGGYWVPTQRMAEVISKLFETSPMRQVAGVMTITGDSVAWPTDTNDGTSGGWVGETATRSETATPQVGEQTLYVREQYAMPKASQKLLDMSTIDVEGWLGAKIADKMSRTENLAYVSGTGVASPRGFLDYSAAAVTTVDASRAWGVLQYIVSGGAGSIPDLSGVPGAKDVDFLINTIAALKPAYRAGATWLMNRLVEAELRKCKDGQGRYLIGMGDISASAVGFNLLNFPIANMEDMPAIASNSFSMAFGNFRAGYQILDGRGIRILRDNLTVKGQVLFYTTKWTGGDVINSDAIKLVKFGTS